MELVYLLFLHFLADFILQPREMGRQKSEKFKYLFQHLLIQFFVFFFGLMVIMPDTYMLFALGNALVHGLIDWNIWNLYKLSVWKRRRSDIELVGREQLKKTWKYWDDHWFYVTIGLDQFLHAATIVVLYVYLG